MSLKETIAELNDILNSHELYELTKKLNPSEELKQKFIDRTKQHIKLVNYYAGKIGASFPNHDHSKLDILLDGYCYFSKPKEERTPEEQKVLDLATFIHVTNAPHHPEYWTETDLRGFTRGNFTPNGVVDATEMPEECLLEMVCDWQATGTEKGNSARDWFNQTNGTRWVFSEYQRKFILDLIGKIED